MDGEYPTVGDMDPKEEDLSPQDLENGGSSLAGRKSSRGADDVDDDDDDDKKGGRERRKIEIKFIQDKSRRHITFSKRKHGIMKKAWELSVLTGTQVLLLVVSETGLVYTYTTPKLQPLVTKPEGKHLIQSCLNAPDSPSRSVSPSGQSVRDETPSEAHGGDGSAPSSAGSQGHPGAPPRPIPQGSAGAPVGPGPVSGRMSGPGGPVAPHEGYPPHMVPPQIPGEHHPGMHGAPPVGLDPNSMMMAQNDGMVPHMPEGYLPADYAGYMPQQRFH